MAVSPDLLISQLPKCELHIHIEGSLEPELMFALARRNNIRLPYESVDALRKAYQFAELQDFLNVYYQGMSVLITERDFFDLAWAYLERAHADNVRHVEMFFDPQGHTSRGVAFETVVNGLHRACREAGDGGAPLEVVVEIDSGQHRTGTSPRVAGEVARSGDDCPNDQVGDLFIGEAAVGNQHQRVDDADHELGGATRIGEQFGLHLRCDVGQRGVDDLLDQVGSVVVVGRDQRAHDLLRFLTEDVLQRLMLADVGQHAEHLCPHLARGVGGGVGPFA